MKAFGMNMNRNARQQSLQMSAEDQVCACRNSWEVIAVPALKGGLFCWEVVTVKDEKLAEASPLSPQHHKSQNITHRILPKRIYAKNIR